MNRQDFIRTVAPIAVKVRLEGGPLFPSVSVAQMILCSIGQESYRKQVNLMDTLIATLQQYLDPKMLIVVIALLILGNFLKQTPLLKDWLIIWILTFVH